MRRVAPMPASLIAGLLWAGAARHNPRMSRILLIDDDEHLAAPLATYFARFDCVLDSATRPSDGLARLRAAHYDAAILDVMLPGIDGFALCPDPRESRHPMVHAHCARRVMDRVVGLELGADDYLPKPFDPRELVARVQTILRRQRKPAVPTATPQRLVFDALVIDLDRREVLRQGERVELTGTEFELLALLARQPGKVTVRGLAGDGRGGAERSGSRSRGSGSSDLPEVRPGAGGRSMGSASTPASTTRSLAKGDSCLRRRRPSSRSGPS